MNEDPDAIRDDGLDRRLIDHASQPSPYRDYDPSGAAIGWGLIVLAAVAILALAFLAGMTLAGWHVAILLTLTTLTTLAWWAAR